MTDFDPYQQWLGIPAAFRPLNYYLLLGISLYESREDIINDACDCRMVMIRQHQSGPRGEFCDGILTELAQAKLVLLDEEKRNDYDNELKRSFELATEIGTDESTSDPPVGVASKSSPKFERPSRSPSAHDSGDRDQGPPARSKEDDPAEFHRRLNLKNTAVFTAVILMTMLATVFALSLWKDNTTTANSNPDGISPGQTDSQQNANENSNRPGDEGDGNKTEEIEWNGPITEQDQMAEISLRPANALVSGKKMAREPTGISGWSSKEDFCTWMINVADRRTSFFHCDITYESNKECRMQLQIGDQFPRTFSVYPTDQPFTERFFVRLGADKQRVTISVLEIEPTASLNLQQIKFTPK